MCSLVSDGKALNLVPVIHCTCNDGLIHEHLLFEGKNPAHKKLMKSVANEIHKAAAAAKLSRELISAASMAHAQTRSRLKSENSVTTDSTTDSFVLARKGQSDLSTDNFR
jgi:hypothetical protein